MAEARKLVLHVWEHGQHGEQRSAELAELVERCMLAAWDSADGRRLHMVTDEGKQFAGCRVERETQRRR